MTKRKKARNFFFNFRYKINVSSFHVRLVQIFLLSILSHAAAAENVCAMDSSMRFRGAESERGRDIIVHRRRRELRENSRKQKIFYVVSIELEIDHLNLGDVMSHLE